MNMNCFCEGPVPLRAHDNDAGLDLFYIGDDVTLHPEDSRLFSTGFFLEIPPGYVGLILDRSSMPSKRGLIVGSKVIDSGYAGELKVNLINVGNRAQTINTNDRIAQLVLLPIITPKLIPVNSKELLYKEIDSSRGHGGFGSTGQ